jgi:hypothetical protein
MNLPLLRLVAMPKSESIKPFSRLSRQKAAIPIGIHVYVAMKLTYADVMAFVLLRAPPKSPNKARQKKALSLRVPFGE